MFSFDWQTGNPEWQDGVVLLFCHPGRRAGIQGHVILIFFFAKFLRVRFNSGFRGKPEMTNKNLTKVL
jgi:hypothetical protein